MSTLLGLILVVVAALDLVLGFVVIAPRATEESRPVLKVAFSLAAAATLALGLLILLGVIPVGAPSA